MYTDDSGNDMTPKKKKQKKSSKGNNGKRKLLKVGNDTVNITNLKNGQQLIIVEGDISKAQIECDAIIHPTNTTEIYRLITNMFY